jgi:hypothetical protein
MIIFLIVILSLMLIFATRMVYRRYVSVNQRVIRAIRNRAKSGRAANDNTKQSFVYRVEKRRRRTW